MRRIRRIGGINVEKPGVRVVAGRIAIPIGEVGGGTTSCVLIATWRLRKLPDGGIRNSAGRCKRRIWRDSASWRGRAGVVEDRVDEVARADVGGAVVGSMKGDVE